MGETPGVSGTAHAIDNQTRSSHEQTSHEGSIDCSIRRHRFRVWTAACAQHKRSCGRYIPAWREHCPGVCSRAAAPRLHRRHDRCGERKGTQQVGSYVGVGGPGRSACPSEGAGEVKGELGEPVDPTRPRGAPGEHPHGAYPQGEQAERYSKRRPTFPQEPEVPSLPPLTSGVGSVLW